MINKEQYIKDMNEEIKKYPKPLKVIGWMCTKCFTYWGDIALGGKISKRSICPFCKGEREVEGVDIYERPKEKNVTDQNQN